MSIPLIALHHIWDGPALAPSQRDRFAAALGIADGQPAQTMLAGQSLLAATARARGWRPQSLADGARVLFIGHLDNRRQLATALGLPGASDEALYAAGWGGWGDAIEQGALPAMLRSGQWASLWNEARHIGKARGMLPLRIVLNQAIAPFLPLWAHSAAAPAWHLP